VTGKEVDEKDELGAIELSATRYCPAQAMLAKVFPMDLKYFIYEDGGGVGDQRAHCQRSCQ